MKAKRRSWRNTTAANSPFVVRDSSDCGNGQRWRRNGLAAADAISFTAAEQAGPIAARGASSAINASSSMVRRRARRCGRSESQSVPAWRLAQSGDRLILWVGRQTSNKSTITILDGWKPRCPRLPPGTQVMMLFGDDTLLEGVEQRVRESAILPASG